MLKLIFLPPLQTHSYLTPPTPPPPFPQLLCQANKLLLNMCFGFWRNLAETKKGRETWATAMKTTRDVSWVYEMWDACGVLCVGCMGAGQGVGREGVRVRVCDVYARACVCAYA